MREPFVPDTTPAADAVAAGGVDEPAPDPVADDRPLGDDAGDPGQNEATPLGDPRILSGRYLLEEQVASGGMASVWRAHDEVLARTVAVKLLHDHLAADEDFRERFRREAIAAAKLTHPNVVGLYDTGSDNGDVYLVMEFIDGSTLKDVIQAQGELEIAQAAAIGEAVGRALDYAHSRGLVHRDVKPANILIGADGAVKVADFGIAKADQTDDLTKTGMVLGTAAYVAPEQIRGETVTGQADQYGLAVVVYEMLTGRQPFKADTPVATAAQRLERDALPVRSLRANAPRSLDALLMRALARDPRNRFPSCGALADALAAFAGADTGETAALVAPNGATAASAWDDTAGRPARAGLGAGWTGVHRAGGGGNGRDAGGNGRESDATEHDSFLRSEGRFLAPVLALLLLAGALIGVGLWTGVLETDAGSAFPRIASQEGQPGQDETEAPDVAAALLNLAGPPVVFDPGGSGTERNRDLPLIVDGDPETFWRTEQYNSRAFGNLKQGVGFYVDLGSPHVLEGVALRTVTPGVTLELRVADAPADALESWRTVATVSTDDELIQLVPDEAVTTRYALIWITGELPQSGDRFSAGFSQIAVTGSPT